MTPGDVFGALTVVALPLATESGVRVQCRCACGRLAFRNVEALERGDATACRECERREQIRARRRQPGYRAHAAEQKREYRRRLVATDPTYREREAQRARERRARKEVSHG